MLGSTANDKFDFNKSDQYTLSIRLSTDGFSFSVHDPEQESIFFCEKDVEPAISVTANLKRIFKETDFLNHTFKKVSVLTVGTRFTLIPEELYEENENSLFHYNHPPKKNEVILNEFPEMSKMAVVFGIDKSVYNFLTSRFPGAVVFHSPIALLIEHFSEMSRFGEMKKMYAYVREKALDIYCFSEGDLLLVNTFECKKDPDRQYYILYIWKQLLFDQEKDLLHLIFEKQGNKGLQRELSRFIKELSTHDHDAALEKDYSGHTGRMPFDLQVLLSKH